MTASRTLLPPTLEDENGCVEAPGRVPRVERLDAELAQSSPRAVRLALERWWYVLRYHRPEQLARRAQTILRRWWDGRTAGGLRGWNPPSDLSLRDRADFRPLLVYRLAERRRLGAESRAAGLRQGRIALLNEERAFGDAIDWRLESWPQASHLWRFQLHYHEFLLDLIAAERPAGIGAGAKGEEKLWATVGHWIAENPLPSPRTLRDAWHPYCISRRLPVWMLAWSAAPPAAPLASRVLESLHRQASFLERRLERDLGGNHLIENARALALTGCFLAGRDADRWLRLAARTLRREIVEQILPHGEHFERSPMYHCAVLDALLDVADGAAEVAPELARDCRRTAVRMADFLSSIVHPDGQIPLFGDSCFDETPPAAALIDRARSGAGLPCIHGGLTEGAAAPEREGAKTVGGYWVFASGEDRLIFDAGPVGADRLPAHAHSDLLTFEASIAGERFLVDSGVAGYADDSLRRYCRGTSAHNALRIDGREQCDAWSRFRLGRRGQPSELATGRNGPFEWAAATHDAYRRYGVPTVGRLVACRSAGPWVCVDWAIGAGTRRLETFLHLHPSVRVAHIDGDLVSLERDGQSFALRFLTPGDIAVAGGWYCPRFGVREEAEVVRWSAGADLPALTGWCLTWGDCRGRGELRAIDGRPAFVWTEAGRRDVVPIPFHADVAASSRAASGRPA